LKVYLCLVEGIEGKRYCAIQTAEYLGIKPPSVTYHIKGLLQGGYIKEISEHSNPKFFCRGPKANIMDKITLESNNRIDGGTVKPPHSNIREPIRGPDKSVGDVNKRAPPRHNASNVRTARVHNCRVDFLVDEVGDVSIFGKPYLERNGVTFWKTKVFYNGHKVSIELRESGKTCNLSIWPPARDMVPEQFGDQAEKVLISEAQDVANYLSKNEGWRFGLLELRTDLEYASQDTELLKEIPESIRTTEANGVWVDCSKGPKEVETKDPEKAKIIVSIPGRIQEIENGQKSTVDRTYVMEMKVDKLYNIIEKLVKVTEMNGEALANLAEQGILETVEKTVNKVLSKEAKTKPSAVSEEECRVMFG